MAHCNTKTVNDSNQSTIIMIKSSEDKWSILNQEIKIFIQKIQKHTYNTHGHDIQQLHTSGNLWKWKMVNKLQHSVCKIQSQDHRYRKGESRERQADCVSKKIHLEHVLCLRYCFGLNWAAEAGWFSSNCKPIRHNHSQRAKQDHGIIYSYRTLSKSQTPGEKNLHLSQKVNSAPFFPKSHKNRHTV